MAHWLEGAIGLAIPIGVMVVMFIKSRQTKIRGSTLTGTARVLSVETTGVAVGESRRPVCRIGLRVQVRGREPYDVTVRQDFLAWEMPAQGETVSVQVEAANPQKVRIDYSQPVVGPPITLPPITLPPITLPPITLPPTESSGPPPTVAALADAYKQSPGSAPVVSAADLLASGQRVRGVLKSFAATGTTPRSLGRTPSRPELLDAPHYVLEVDLQFPNMAPITGRSTQPVPVAQVPNLAIGLQLACVVDPADPSHRFVVDWGGIAY
jgi:hypothetical protein